MLIPANPDGTCCCPHDNSAKGSPLDSTAMTTINHQSRVLDKLGICTPRQRIRAYSASAAMLTRHAANVSGSKSRRATRTVVKAPPQMMAMNPIRNQLISPGSVLVMFCAYRGLGWGARIISLGLKYRGFWGTVE